MNGKRPEPTKPAESKVEAVDRPPHYNTGSTEAIDIIALVLEHASENVRTTGFNIGNAVKYICRHQHKGNPIIELEKARWYLQQEIRDIERCQTSENS